MFSTMNVHEVLRKKVIILAMVILMANLTKTSLLSQSSIIRTGKLPVYSRLQTPDVVQQVPALIPVPDVRQSHVRHVCYDNFGSI